MAQSIVIQGEDRVLRMGAIDSAEKTYIDLTGVTEITVSLAATTGPAISFLLSASEVAIVDAAKGKFNVTMSDTKTALLKVGEPIVEVILDRGAPTAGNRRIMQIEKQVLVKKKQY